MFKSYTQPWFVLYSIAIAGIMFTGIWLGLISMLLVIIPIFLVDAGKWPDSKKWMNYSSKFKSRNRVCVGGLCLIGIIAYFFYGLGILRYCVIMMGIMLFWVERLIIDQNIK